MMNRDLYNFQSRSYWLRRLENHDRKERVSVDEYTIEHIMPQNTELSEEWRADLGPDWKRIHEIWLHKLGNLTLTGYNSEYGDKPFSEKRDMKRGFRDSPLRINEGLGQIEKWDEDAIKNRAQRLAKVAVEVRKAPKLPEGSLKEYLHEPQVYSAYSIEDHPSLMAPKLRELFEAFSKEVRALDPCVSEGFLKSYVGYRAETSFAIVFPRAKQLNLLIIMPFADIDDPRGICRNVSDVRYAWRNAEVEVKLEELDDLPYVIGLVRQALEVQLGDENGA